MIMWAVDVVELYFDVVDLDERLEPSRERFLSLISSRSAPQPKFIPYRRSVDLDLPTVDQLENLARRRRSVRWFLQQSVPRDIVDRCLLVGTQSPSACNRQPFRFHIFDDPDLIQQIGRIPMGATGFVENVPMLMVVVGQQRAFHHHRDRHLIYIDSALAVMPVELALECHGLNTCTINWPAIPELETRMEQLIGLSPDEQPILLLAIGYPDPDGLVPFSQKKGIGEVRRFIL